MGPEAQCDDLSFFHQIARRLHHSAAFAQVGNSGIQVLSSTRDTGRKKTPDSMSSSSLVAAPHTKVEIFHFPKKPAFSHLLGRVQKAYSSQPARGLFLDPFDPAVERVDGGLIVLLNPTKLDLHALSNLTEAHQLHSIDTDVSNLDTDHALRIDQAGIDAASNPKFTSALGVIPVALSHEAFYGV